MILLPEEKDLQGECTTGRETHQCLAAFRAQPAIVKQHVGTSYHSHCGAVGCDYYLCLLLLLLLRNWRLLWASLPRDKRKQALLDMMIGSGGQMKFAGIRVCTRAFQKLSGVSAGAIQDVREKIAKGTVTIWRSDGLAYMEIRNQAQAHRYLDARAWIEAYSELHGEQSPMSLRIYLPAGRKYFYHAQYQYERRLG